MRKTFVRGLGPALLLALLAPLPAPANELKGLRDLEERTVRTIAASEKAFVFIEGGSGFLISADGYVLTNEHVIGGRAEAISMLTTGQCYRARAVGHDPEGDVALLKIDGVTDLPFLELGDSSRLRVGEEVIALGDPFLLASASMFFDRRIPPSQQPSASLGVVSALHRYSDTYSDAIQVDVAVNRGNSGGPLLTLDGKVVGINGKIETRFAMGVNSGVGYAVPSNQIKNFLEALKAAGGGRVEHGYIAGLDVEERATRKPGLAVRDVAPGSTAEKAGFRKDDLVVAVDGLPLSTRTRYKGILSTYPAGREVSVSVRRGDESLELRARLEVKTAPYLGVQIENGPQGGALVKDVVPGGPAAQAGIKVGDIILILQGNRVGSADELRQLLRTRLPGDTVGLGVLREKNLIPVEVRLVQTPSRSVSMP